MNWLGPLADIFGNTWQHTDLPSINHVRYSLQQLKEQIAKDRTEQEQASSTSSLAHGSARQGYGGIPRTGPYVGPSVREQQVLGNSPSVNAAGNPQPDNGWFHHNLDDNNATGEWADSKAGLKSSRQQRADKQSVTLEQAKAGWTPVASQHTESNWGTKTVDERWNVPNNEQSWLREHGQASVNIWDGQVGIEGSLLHGEWGSENNKLTVDGFGAGAGADGRFALDLENGFVLGGNANAEVYLVKAEYEGSYGPGYVKAEAFVGAEANVGGNIEFNPLKGDVNANFNAEAFVGGKLEGETGVRGEYGQANVNGSLNYGLGAEFDANVGMDDGVIKAKVDIGATLGIGGDIGFDVELDGGAAVGYVGDKSGAAIDFAGDAAGDIAGGIGDKASSIVSYRPW